MSGCSMANVLYESWCVVADLPLSSPVWARRKAPVHTDMVMSAPRADLRTHSSVASLRPCCAGITTTFGAGASANV